MKNQRGFTLMEMLIVVAIIAVMIAIAIPSMSDALERSREASDLATIRQICAELTQLTLSDGKVPANFYYDKKSNTIRACVLCKGKKAGWQTKNLKMSGSGVIICEAVCYAPATDKPYLSIKINRGTNQFTFTREDGPKTPLYR